MWYDLPNIVLCEFLPCSAVCIDFHAVRGAEACRRDLSWSLLFQHCKCQSAHQKHILHQSVHYSVTCSLHYPIAELQLGRRRRTEATNLWSGHTRRPPQKMPKATLTWWSRCMSRARCPSTLGSSRCLAPWSMPHASCHLGIWSWFVSFVN